MAVTGTPNNHPNQGLPKVPEAAALKLFFMVKTRAHLNGVTIPVVVCFKNHHLIKIGINDFAMAPYSHLTAFVSAIFATGFSL